MPTAKKRSANEIYPFFIDQLNKITSAEFSQREALIRLEAELRNGLLAFKKNEDDEQWARDRIENTQWEKVKQIYETINRHVALLSENNAALTENAPLSAQHQRFQAKKALARTAWTTERLESFLASKNRQLKVTPAKNDDSDSSADCPAHTAIEMPVADRHTQTSPLPHTQRSAMVTKTTGMPDDTLLTATPTEAKQQQNTEVLTVHAADDIPFADQRIQTSSSLFKSMNKNQRDAAQQTDHQPTLYRNV